MRRKVPKVLRSIVLEILKTLLTTAVVWLVFALLGISFLLGKLGPFLSEAIASTIVGLPLGVQIP